MSGRQYIGVSEVAVRYRTSKTTVYEWIRKEAVPYRKIAGMKAVLFLPEHLDAFDDGCELESVRVKGGKIIRPKTPD